MKKVDYFTYKNGNQTGWTHDISGPEEKDFVDEENRMRSLSKAIRILSGI
jgi:hypothetical protein